MSDRFAWPMPFGASVEDHGIRFRLWAPALPAVSLCLENGGRDRQLLHSLGVEIGAKLIWLPKLLRGEAPRIRALLCSVALGKGVRIEAPRPGAVALIPDPTIDPDAYTVLGYPVFGTRALRADIVERASATLTELAAGGPFELPADLAARVGIRRDELPELVAALGFAELDDGRWQAANRDRAGRAATR